MPSSPEQPPKPAPSSTALVSVIVRSLDRPQLRQALDSVAMQTHPLIEVVVVAARTDHAPLSAKVGQFPLRLIEADAARPRSLAANVGLERARGRYLLLLDDDDWLMPDHIARLVDTLEHHPSSRAAYTGVALVDADGRPSGQAFDLPFDAVRQMAGNLTPIHAVLFEASLVKAGCRFDEGLDRYEDWDFWLQLARHTVFVHLPGVSAVYRIHDSSGVHADPATASLQLYERWQGRWGPQDIGQLMRRVWSHAELELQYNTAEERRRLADSQSQAALAALASITHRLDQLNQQFAADQSQLAGQAEQLRTLSSQLHLQSDRLQLQSVQIDSQAATLDRQASQLGTLTLEVAQQTARADRAQAAQQALLNSTSWQITMPLRWIVNLLRVASRPFRH